jgi:putative sugar O-methyltransferase
MVRTMTQTLTAAPAFCFLRDQTPLSQLGFQKAQRCRDWARSLVENREKYIRANGLDGDVHLPHGNWELGGGLYAAYRIIRDGGYDVYNYLRMYSDIFTGYQLSAMARSVGKPVPESLSPNLDDQLAEWAAHPDVYVEAYRRITSYLNDELYITPPRTFGEVGWLLNGKIVNHDTFVYLERLILLAESGKLGELREKKPARILEIGGGFGGLAYHFKKLAPQARYYIVDIPESLIFSSIYLTTLHPDQENVLITPNNLGDLKKDAPGFTFIPNYLFDQCRAAGLTLDLAINTLSMSEMIEKQVRYYCEGLKAMLGDSGGFFEQNQDNRSVGFIDAKSYIRDHFPCCTPLSSPVLHLTQGKAHLWTTTPYQRSIGAWQWKKSGFVAPAPTGAAQQRSLNFLRRWWEKIAGRLWKAS